VCIVDVLSNNQDQITLPRGQIFRAISGDTTVKFVNLETYVMSPSSFNDDGTISSISTGPIEIYQGDLREVSFIHDEGIPFRKYTIPYENIDATTIKVNVQVSEDDNTGSEDVWEEAKDITKVSQDSKVFFLEEGPRGFYQIYFGDGVIGKRLEDGNKITVSVLETDAIAGNGIGENDNSNTFTINLGYTIDVLVPSSGGQERETKESIKINAPKSFTTQERAVTSSDYKNIITKEFPNIKSVSSWGGEENTPPEYGKVYVSVNTESGLFLSEEEKENIINSILKKRSVVGIVPVVVDPDVTYIQLEVSATIDPIKLKTTRTNLESRIKNKIFDFAENNIYVFDGDFYTNKILSSILETDPSIITSEIDVLLEKRFNPSTFQKLNYTLNFKNEIYISENCDVSVVNSTGFYYYDNKTAQNRLCQLKDSSGMINIVYVDATTEEEIVLLEIGSVDYDTGIVQLNEFQPTSLVDANPLSVIIRPRYKDIMASKNDILSLDLVDSASIDLTLSYIPYKGKSN
jgi:hypothetical protein